MEFVDDYRVYAEHVRKIARHMKLADLERAAEFHLLAWRVLRAEHRDR